MGMVQKDVSGKNSEGVGVFTLSLLIFPHSFTLRYIPLFECLKQDKTQILLDTDIVVILTFWAHLILIFTDRVLTLNVNQHPLS